jgi:putative Holliday junction resolvase
VTLPPGRPAGPPGRAAGVDFGGRWFGLALSDGDRRFARPLEVVAGKEEAIARLAELVKEEGVTLVVLGLPRNMDGSLGPKAREVLAFAETLKARLTVVVETWDERLTTLEAERYLREAGLRGKRMGERVNQVAAQILLQSFLDSRRAAESEGESAAESEGESEEPEPEDEPAGPENG